MDGAGDKPRRLSGDESIFLSWVREQIQSDELHDSILLVRPAAGGNAVPAGGGSLATALRLLAARHRFSQQSGRLMGSIDPVEIETGPHPQSETGLRFASGLNSMGWDHLDEPTWRVPRQFAISGIIFSTITSRVTSCCFNRWLFVPHSS